MERSQDSVREQEEVGSGRGITRGGMTPCIRQGARKKTLQEDSRWKKTEKIKYQWLCSPLAESSARAPRAVLESFLFPNQFNLRDGQR
jgi:hypothetical protein